MKKSKSYYFKRTFYFVFSFLFVYFIVKGLFEIDYSTESVYKLLLKSVVAAAVTSVLMGFINMQWLKRENFFVANKNKPDKQ